MPVTMEPITRATRNITGFFIIGTTKIPPCAATDSHPEPTAIAPATAEPIMEAGMKCNGSAAAKGRTPSVMKQSPIGSAVLAVSISVLVNLSFFSKVAINRPIDDLRTHRSVDTISA